MGMPVISVTFEQLADSALARSARGIVALILADETEGSAVCEYRRGDIIPDTQWDADNACHIKAALAGAQKVLAVRLLADGYEATLEGIKNSQWTWLAAPSASAAEVQMIAEQIKKLRSDGVYKKAVLGNAKADSAGVVNVATNNIVSTLYPGKTLDANSYAPRIAGVLAGLGLDKSVTGREFSDIVSAEDADDPSSDIAAGRFVIVRDGMSYVAARGVTSLTGKHEPAVFRKIKHVEGADMIAEDMKLMFKTGFFGERANSYSNKQSLAAEYIAYFKSLEGSVLSPEFDNRAQIDVEAQRAYLESMGVDTYDMDDMQICKANTGDKVFIKANIQLMDAMEDIYIVVALS